MDSDSVKSTDDDALITSYLVRVRRAARHLPSGRRNWVVGQVGDRLAGALEASDDGGRRVAAIVAGLGEPRDLVQAVDGHVPGTESGWMEFTAILLVLAGGVLWRAAWLVGVTLLWVSPRWRWQDKLLATLVWPGGLAVAGLLMVRYTTSELIAGGGRFVRPYGSVHYLLDSTLGHPPLRHLLVLLAASVPPVLVAIRLLRRARRPDQPHIAAALAQPAVTGPAITGPAAGGPAVTGPGAGTGQS